MLDTRFSSTAAGPRPMVRFARRHASRARAASSACTRSGGPRARGARAGRSPVCAPPAVARLRADEALWVSPGASGVCSDLGPSMAERYRHQVSTRYAPSMVTLTKSWTNHRLPPRNAGALPGPSSLPCARAGRLGRVTFASRQSLACRQRRQGAADRVDGRGCNYLGGGRVLRLDAATGAYLITVRGRKSGLPRTVVLSVIEADGSRYLTAPFESVEWVRNLRASGEAVLTRGRRSETVHAPELSPKDAAEFLRNQVRLGRLSARYFEVAPQSSLEDFESAPKRHPVFLLDRR